MPPQHVVRFGPFAADLTTGELSEHGTTVRLHGQPIQVLAMLLERPGEMVTRDELRARLWGAHSYVDFDHGLHAAVNKLRHALSDSADHPRYIETIPRRGYRFIGMIDSTERTDWAAEPSPAAADAPAVADTAPDQVAAGAPPSRQPWPRRFSSPVLYAGAIPIAVAAAAVFWLSHRSTTPSSTPTDARLMLAVLPFENLSGDPEQEYFSDGLTEELITRLGQLDSERLAVIARTSVMSYKRSSKPVRQISRELGVDYVLEGSVRHADARVRVAAQLIRASDETHVWAGSYDRSLGELLPVQTEIARAVAGELQFRLPGVYRSTSTGGRPVRWEAHEAVLRGRYFLEQRTVAAIHTARGYFERAIALEPRYAKAYVGLADAHILEGIYSDVPSREAMMRAREAVLTALALDEREASAHAWLGSILTEHDWDWTGAERSFRRALELDPNFAPAHKLYAEYLSYVGRFDQSLAEAQVARRLDPLSVVSNSLIGLVLYRARRYVEALDALQQAIELDPDHPMPYLPQGLALSMLGRHDEAIAALEKGVAVSDRSSEMLAQLALASGRAGQTDRASALLAELEARSRTQHVSWFNFALVHTGLGDRRLAIEALEAAYRDREWYLCVLKTEPVFDPLRGEPRFQDLLRRVSLPS